MAREKNQRNFETDHNPDAITGEPGAHPVGAGLGAAAGGAVAGAAGGAIAGPVGAAIGAVVGGLAGGLAGKAMAEEVDPTAEYAYWEENYRSRPYVSDDATYDQYGPAYRYGYESRARSESGDFDAMEADLQSDWDEYRGDSGLDWQSARPAIRDAWERATNQYGTTKKPR